jgi:uncharacterized protein
LQPSPSPLVSISKGREGYAEMADAPIKSSGQKSPPGTIEVEPSVDKMRMLLTCVVPEGEELTVFKEVQSRLLTLRIEDRQVLAQAEARFMSALQQDRSLESVVLFEGTPPTPPTDATILWAADFFSKEFKVDEETGRMDYRERTVKRTVREGQHLATLTEAEAGTPGIDVLGKPALPREPELVRLRAGRNVRCDEAARTYYATASGQIRHFYGIVQVDDVYVISGSVDLGSRNIDHPGALVVGNSIESETEVEAGGNVEVRGTVENAKVTAGGNLSVQGGISGGDRCVVRVGGDLHARYIKNADVEVEGDVLVESEIMQSTVKARGKVSLVHGRIVGGETIALRGMDMDQIGSDGDVKTTVSVGYDFRLRGQVAIREKEVSESKRKLEVITQQILPFKQRGMKIPPNLKEKVTGLLQEAKSLQETIQTAESEIETLREEAKALAVLEILVRKHVLPDVQVKLRPQSIWLRNALKGPLGIFLRGNRIKVLRGRFEGRRFQAEEQEEEGEDSKENA